MRNVVVHPGQKVVTSAGIVAIVAFVQFGQVWAWVNGQVQPVTVKTDAFGGEHDQTIGLAA